MKLLVRFVLPHVHFCRLLCSAQPSINSFSLRSHNCGELRRQDVGKRVKLYGWLSFARMNKFLVLKDAYGKVQAFVPKQLEAEAKQLTEESSVCLHGTVVERPAKDRNSEMATGDIEILVEKLEILNLVDQLLPVFEKSSNEDTRLAHRYLDLRSEQMQHALRLRAKVIGKMRRYLEDQCGFVDIQTPTLAHFTPGGAAEFPVPAGPTGECYSLPQSPQLYKQLLMCGSLDRYYQIAICYRDEQLNPFRQPEFTQLDLELSYTDQQSIMELVEQIIVQSWPDDLPRPSAPFPRLPYKEALHKFGSDKPDLRVPWEISDCPLASQDKRLKFFVAKRAAPHLKSEDLTAWNERIAVMPYRQEYAIVSGARMENPAELAEIKVFLNRVDIPTEKAEHWLKQFMASLNMTEEDALVLCWGIHEEKICKVLGYLRNYLADAAGLRTAQQFHFVWVHKFPLFTRNEENGQLESSHHPFTAPIQEHLELLRAGKDLEKLEAQHYDLVLNGVEIGGGSVRIHDAELQRHVLEDVLRLDTSHLSHFLAALRFGAPPHGGFALGLDRYLAILNAKGDPNASIRSVIAFPKSSSSRRCLMTGSPAQPSNELLAKYGLLRRAKGGKSEGGTQLDEDG